ncbi:MAG: hypothetical protein ACOCWO_04815, partial [Candidatus Muiribacteriaceae bacterium]
MNMIEDSNVLELFNSDNQEKKLQFLNMVYSGKVKINKDILRQLLDLVHSVQLISAIYLVMGKIGDEADAFAIAGGLR